MRTLVLGVGNPLMSDDGVGQRLLAELASLQPSLADVDYVDAGTLSFLLLPRIEDCTALLVLDAARLGGAPGEVREFSGADMDEFLKSASCSVHEIGMRDLLDAARLTEALPARRALVGVQPDRVAWGEHTEPSRRGCRAGRGGTRARHPRALATRRRALNRGGACNGFGSYVHRAKPLCCTLAHSIRGAACPRSPSASSFAHAA